MFEHSIDRLHDPNVARFNRKLYVIQENQWKINGIQWKSMKSNENQYKVTIFPKTVHYAVEF